MERIVVNNMLLIERSTEVDCLVDHSVDDDESFSREEFRPFFEFIDLKFAPKPVHLLDTIVLTKS